MLSHVQTPITWPDPGNSPRRCGGGLPQHPAHSCLTMIANLEANSHQAYTGCTRCVFQCRKTMKKKPCHCVLLPFSSRCSLNLSLDRAVKALCLERRLLHRSTNACGLTGLGTLEGRFSLEPCVEAVSNPCGSWGTFFNVLVKSERMLTYKYNLKYLVMYKNKPFHTKLEFTLNTDAGQ